MKNTWIIFNKEAKAFFTSPTAYIFLIVFLLITGWFFFNSFFIVKEANLRGLFDYVPWIFLFFVPAVAMRLWAEEKKSGTAELLMTLPIRDAEAVAGKYLASLQMLFWALVLTFPLPLIVSHLADVQTGVDWGPVIGGYIGLFLLGATFLSIGTFVSALTNSQIVAFILGVSACFAIFIVGQPFVLDRLPAWLAGLAAYIGLGGHLSNISQGIIDSRDLIYYGSVIFLFLYLTSRTIENRGWH